MVETVVKEVSVPWKEKKQLWIDWMLLLDFLLFEDCAWNMASERWYAWEKGVWVVFANSSETGSTDHLFKAKIR